MHGNINLATARLRWTGYEVSGDGRLAVVYECCRKVVLVQTPIEASVLRQERCGQHCSYKIAPEGGWHKISKLDDPRRDRNNAETFGNIAALMEQD
jgi:hypothetical protein